MFKRLFLGLIVLLVMSAGLYQLRIQILTAAFNATLAQADIQLLQLKELKLGWSGVDIDTLVLAVGKDRALQTFEGVHIGYSVMDARAHSVLVKQAVLKLPTPATEQENNTPLVLTDVLDRVLAAPLQAITIEGLEVEGLSVPVLKPPITLQANWEENKFQLVVKDQDKQLHLALSGLQEDEGSLSANLSVSGESAMKFDSVVSRQGNRYHIEGGGQLRVDAGLPVLAAFIELPEAVTQASGELLFQLSGQMADDLTDLEDQSWRLQLLPQSALSLLIDRADMLANLRLNIHQPLIVTYLTGPARSPLLSLLGEGVAWHLYEQTNNVTVEGQLSAINCQFKVALRCRSLLEMELSSPQLIVTGEVPLVMQRLALKLTAKLNLVDDQLSAILAPGEWLRAKSLQRGDVLVSGPALITESAGELEYRISSGELDLKINELQLLLPQVKLPEIDVASLFRMQDLEFALDKDGRAEGGVHLGTDAINIQRADTWLPSLAFDSDVLLSGQKVSLKARVSGGGQKPMFEVSGEHHIDVGRGTARILTEKMSFDADDNRLSRHFAYWPFEWDIFYGKLNLDIGLKWWPGDVETGLEGSISQQAQDIAGVYKDIGFVGLNSSFTAKFRAPDQLHTLSSATISLDSLDVGVPIEGLEARFSMDIAKQELIVDSAEAYMFGGRVWVDEALYRADKPHNPVYIGVSNLQLQQLLELTAYDAIGGTGTISGLLPLDINRAGITMERGMLAARAPGGVFRYHTEIVDGTNPAMAQVIEALKNYKYSIFQVEADYLENGDLVLAMVLRGSNPDLQQGRPIHLNLNVTDNIPTLLRSLQAGRVVADSVSKKLGGGAH